MKRSNEFRRAASECLVLARRTTDASTRLNLLTMAKKFLDLADENFESTPFVGLVQDFNDGQMRRSGGPAWT